MAVIALVRKYAVGEGFLRRSLFVFILGCAIALCPSLFSQSFTSSITGVVNDPTGAVVPGAKVVLRNLANNDTHDFTSQGNGSYQFNNLQPGTYQITVTAPGFKTAVQQNLILQAQTQSTVNIGLEVGANEVRVEVSSSALLVDTQTANNVTTLDSQLMEALPNSTRQPLNFVFAVAGTTIAPGGQTQTNGSLDQMAANFGMNGGRTGNESILIDGAPSQALDWGGLMVSPLQDSVQEQQLVVNTYDAQYERGGGGIVTLITKGGTNNFHGEAYDYLQNDVLDANYWSNNKYGIPRGEFKQNQFGGNLGGPLLKRAHLYLFTAYEGFRQPNTQSTGLETVPTVAERNGDFSQDLNSDGTLRTVYNPFSTVTANNDTGFTRTAFPGNMIPASLINPVGQKIVNLYPMPNRQGFGPSDIDNYYQQGAGGTDNDKIDERVDWEQSTTHRMFVRFSDRIDQNITLPCFACNGADNNVNQTNTGFQAVINDTITPSPTWVINDFVSYSRWREAHTAQDYGQASASTIGLPNSDFQAPLLPTIYPDQTYAPLGNGTFERFVRYSETAQNNTTKEFGKHTLKFGANYDVGMINVINEAAGSFNFSTAMTSCDPSTMGPCDALNYSASATGDAIASMLLGTASGGSSQTNIDPAFSQHTYGVYIQDQWRVSPRLTINAGVRYENQRPATERYNRVAYFDPTVLNPISSAIGQNVYGGFEYASSSNRYAWQPDNLTFAPRMGIAYRITDKLVFRAGAGIFFLNPSALLGDDGGAEFQGFNAYTNYNATGNGGYTPSLLINNPFPSGINQPTGSSQGLNTLVGDGQSNVWYYGPHPIGYTENWSAAFQYEINPHTIFEASYTGNRGRKLLYGNPNLDADTLSPQYLSLGYQLDAQVPNPYYGNIAANPNSYLNTAQTISYNELLRPYPEFTYLVLTRSEPGAESQFDALNLKLNHAFSNGLSLLMTYQWSKAMDDGPEDYFGWAFSNSQWRDPYNTKLDYNISTHDVPQSFVTALVYDLPYGKGKRWGGDAPFLVRQALGNWQVSTITRFASGLPLQQIINSYSNELNNFGYQGPQYPNLIGDPRTANQTADNWINPAAFASPSSPFVFGNIAMRETTLREREARNVDFAVAKSFGNELLKAQFRAEFLNLFNYAQYNNFCEDLSQSSCYPFGAAQGTENNPRTIQMSLKASF